MLVLGLVLFKVNIVLLYKKLFSLNFNRWKSCSWLKSSGGLLKSFYISNIVLFEKVNLVLLFKQLFALNFNWWTSCGWLKSSGGWLKSSSGLLKSSYLSKIVLFKKVNLVLLFKQLFALNFNWWTSCGWLRLFYS
jgi:hypothetical protein